MDRYSQNFEQDYILSYFDGKPAGKFLDIGAFDGVTFSNTYALLQLGWSGVEVEASPAVFKVLQERLKGHQVDLVNACVVSEPVMGLIPFYDEHGALGTTEVSQTEVWKALATFNKIHLMPVHVNAILGYFGTDYKMCSIDVEGKSAELFKVVFPQLPMCDLFVVEHDGQQDAIRAMAEGFSVLYENGENLVLGRK